MSSERSNRCVLLPCATDLNWAVPQGCLGEIVTVGASEEQPPAAISWRGESVPVVDFGPQDTLSWRDRRNNTGLVAVVLGLRGGQCPYFGVALRGCGLGISSLDADGIEELPRVALDYAIAAFRMNGTVYQVPDLPALQRVIGTGTTPIH